MLPSTAIVACLLAFQFLEANAITTQRVCANTKKTADCKYINNDASERIRCETVDTNTDCLLKLNSKNATFGRFQTEEALVAAAFVTKESFRVVAEIRHQSRQNEKYSAKMVAIVPATFKGGLNELRNATYCHPGFNREKYWTDAIWQTFENKVNETRTCQENSTYIEERTAALSGFFSKACRPGDWTADTKMDKHLKKKHPNLCSLCDNPSECKYKSSVQYPSLHCLTEKRADVALAFLQEVRDFFNSQQALPTPTISSTKASDYKFLCPDFSTQDIYSQEVCAWVTQPWPVVVAVESEANTVYELLKDSIRVRGRPQVDDALRDILKEEMEIINLDQSSNFLSVREYVTRSRAVPDPIKSSCSPEVRLCTSNHLETDKCLVLSAAVQTHGISPSLSCIQSQSIFDCLKKVNMSEADIVSVPTNLGFIARGTQKLVSSRFIDDSENNLGIAVVKVDSPIKRIKDIKGKAACFPAFNGFGYMTFMEAAYEASLVGKSWCPLSDSTVKIFNESCAPGATDALYAQNPAPENTSLCSGCYSKQRVGASCSAIESNKYFGNAGAIRCLADDSGQVAFLEYHAYNKFMSGSKTGEDTSIDPANFRILCNNGSTVPNINLANKDDIANCVHLRVMKTEILTRGGQTKKRERDIQRFLADLDDWFGLNAHYDNIVGLYGPFLGQDNVLFPTEGLTIADEDTPTLQNYLDLQQRLQHCNSCSATIATLIALLIPLLATLL